MNDIQDDWKWQQRLVIHCPNEDCNGMLLQSDYNHEMRCSKCKDYFVQQTKHVKIYPEDYK